MIKKTVFLCAVTCDLLATAPALQAKVKPSRDTLTLIGFNDFHGSFQQTADIPGAAALVHTLGLWRQTIPNMHVLAGGDNYSGGYFTRITGGQPLAELFEALGVEYSAIGNHEFDWGVPAMVERFNWG
ncbi:MAG: 2',3'-cyclic-nucleotide 2'-phosphodiesterase, partial [Bacteroidales bacterium]|nr:2',3'-cyclic-nucleotide 2'-phosphodiesterase [Bacteroidales bacterium]